MQMCQGKLLGATSNLELIIFSKSKLGKIAFSIKKKKTSFI